MKILITGATGMIGQEIVTLCHQSNIDVHYLTTSKSKLEKTANYKGFFWDPENNQIDVECFDGVEVIINLVGATIAKRWTSSYKQEIINSRVETANLILASLKDIDHHVRHIVSASAIGIYPSSFQKYYREDSPEEDTGFLGKVVKKWEDAVLAFQNIGVQVSLLRIGLVLSNDGGAFPKIAQPIRYGLGAVFGNGNQWQSWIHIADLARMFMFIVREELSGIYNAVAPNPVSNEKLTHTIANTMNKKIILPGIPKFVMQLVLGEMHVLLYASQRVSSTKISNEDFNFKYENVTPAVKDLINGN
ncbi:TIGR01777 family oxidoreductase [Aquimarina sp. U1-2]|uniref:TIGR01777 family oxidoreductase n=1 Tax=Aquimarina sp. U1-2 TaxID=2823141 RepID=UPI001AEC93CF|nr:TIGR01777 family oxidoreductase [Aquimarina sp. U1-2]MBP2834181.1 TIGR01777 family oxidoreductase [Aquimarina sp. U1-2]